MRGSPRLAALAFALVLAIVAGAGFVGRVLRTASGPAGSGAVTVADVAPARQSAPPAAPAHSTRVSGVPAGVSGSWIAELPAAPGRMAGAYLLELDQTGCAGALGASAGGSPCQERAFLIGPDGRRVGLGQLHYEHPAGRLELQGGDGDDCQGQYRVERGGTSMSPLTPRSSLATLVLRAESEACPDRAGRLDGRTWTRYLAGPLQPGDVYEARPQALGEAPIATRIGGLVSPVDEAAIAFTAPDADLVVVQDGVRLALATHPDGSDPAVVSWLTADLRPSRVSVIGTGCAAIFGAYEVLIELGPPDDPATPDEIVATAHPAIGVAVRQPATLAGVPATVIDLTWSCPDGGEITRRIYAADLGGVWLILDAEVPANGRDQALATWDTLAATVLVRAVSPDESES